MKFSTHKVRLIVLPILVFLIFSSCRVKETPFAENSPPPAAVTLSPVQTPVPDKQIQNLSTPSDTAQSTRVPVPAQKTDPQKMKEAEDLYEQGFQAYMESNYSEALRLFNRALAVDGGSFKAFNGKGIVLCFLGNYQEGMAMIRRSLELNPDFPYANFNMAMAYKLQKDYDNSLVWFQKAIVLDPKDSWSYYGISTIFADRNQTEKSLEYLKKSIELDPSVKDAAKTQDHFDLMRNNPEFLKLLK